MSDNLPDMHVSESDADDIYTPERLDNSPDIHTLERSSTCNDQESILKKAKLIRNFGITYFWFFIVVIILLSISIWTAAIILASIFSIVDLVFTIIAIVKIKNTDWGNENLNKHKKVFWVTTLCCLIVTLIVLPLDIISPIMWIVWSKKVKNTYSTNTQK